MMQRRQFLQGSLCTAALAGVALAEDTNDDSAPEISVDLPRARVPLSFIIDDSTCLVNMGHFCMPQFAACYPNREDYQRPWREWPREIPDTFVRDFGEWCAAHDVKGKYSIVPNPACVGWLDRELPGWSNRELTDSLKLVRELMVPNWDIHPEMITHTRVIDLKTGRPMEEISPATMENSYPQEPISTDHLTAYLAYALQILKNCDLPCEGITTPGGFGNGVKDVLGLAVRDAVADVYGVSQNHYFKYIKGGNESTVPTMEHLDLSDPAKPRFTMNVPAGTGDWFGGWDGDREVEGHRYANADASTGRMVELIERREPAVMLCHWPGLYNHGAETGFDAFKKIVLALAERFGDQTQWMKVSEIGHYWAAKELANLQYASGKLTIDSPLACSDFTIRIEGRRIAKVEWMRGEAAETLEAGAALKALQPGRWYADDDACYICLDLAPGQTTLRLS